MKAPAETSEAAIASERATDPQTDRDARIADLANELGRALEHQAATGEILQVISRSPADVRPVFEAIVRSAVRLCDADYSVAATFDGERMEPLAWHGFSDDALSILRESLGRPNRDTMLGRVAWKRAVDVVPDMLADPHYSRDYAIAGGWRSGLGVPMMHNGQMIGAIGVARKSPGAFPERLIKLLQTFADQAVIAVENVRLVNELASRNRDLAESLEQQRATAEILAVINRSRRDVQPVFDTIAAAACKLCDAGKASLLTYDGEWLHLGALANVDPHGADTVRNAFPRKADKGTVIGRTILTGGVVALPDALADPEYEQAFAHAAGFRSILAVPLIQDGKPIGGISVIRSQPGEFSPQQVALLRTFADQAVIAIENAQLFRKLGDRNARLEEALEQKNATSEILRVIAGSPTDAQPVFDLVAKRAGKLCNADVAVISRFDGSRIDLAAIDGLVPHAVEIVRQVFPMPIDAPAFTARTIRDAKPVHVADALAEPEYGLKDFARAAGYRAGLCVPIAHAGEVFGAIFVGRAIPGLFSPSEVSLLKTFADQAVIAIENVRLFNALEERTRALTRSVDELKALGEVGQAVSSTLDLPTVLHTIVSHATRLAGMDGGSVWEYDEARGEFDVHATDRLPDELVALLRSAPIRKGEGALGRLAITGEPVEIRNIADESTYQSRLRESLLRSGYCSILAVPLRRDQHLLGALAVNRSVAGPFPSSVVELLQTFATQSALAIQNARLYREIEHKSRELEAASRHKSEFLANMSHELRTPLNAIIGFSEVLYEKLFGPINDKQAEYISDILESARHLLALINDILDLSKIEAGRMELEPVLFELSGAIENALILVRERAQRKGIFLAASVDPAIGTLCADERKVKQVVLNLLSNAIKFTPEGGKIELHAAKRDGQVEIAVSDTGVGIPPAEQDAVFDEFRQVGPSSNKAEGTGLGLAICRRFVELHGGRIGLTSAVGKGSTFAFTLPLRSAPVILRPP